LCCPNHSPLYLQAVQCKIVLHRLLLLGHRRAEAAPIVDENETRTLKVDDHVGLVIAIHIDKAQGHGDEGIAGAVELGTEVDNIYMENIDPLRRGSVYSRK